MNTSAAITILNADYDGLPDDAILDLLADDSLEPSLDYQAINGTFDQRSMDCTEACDNLSAQDCLRAALPAIPTTKKRRHRRRTIRRVEIKDPQPTVRTLLDDLIEAGYVKVYVSPQEYYWQMPQVKNG